MQNHPCTQLLARCGRRCAEIAEDHWRRGRNASCRLIICDTFAIFRDRFICFRPAQNPRKPLHGLAQAGLLTRFLRVPRLPGDDAVPIEEGKNDYRPVA